MSEKHTDVYSRMAALESQSDNIFRFPNGVPGFENFKNFYFFCKSEVSPLFFMEPVGSYDFGFVCVSSCLFGCDYSEQIASVEMEDIRAGSMGDIAVVSIVTMESMADDATVNLTAPIFINMKNHICRQVVCDGSVCDKQKLSIKCKIMDRISVECGVKMLGVLMGLKGV